MSHSAGVDVSLYSPNNKLSGTCVIDLLLKKGWTIDDHGFIFYLPLHDDEMFDWQREPVQKWPEIRTTLSQKERAEETIGLALTWQDSQIGGTFLVAASGTHFSADWQINRQQVKCTPTLTDHSWYLTRVLRPLLENGIQVKSVQCYDYPS